MFNTRTAWAGALAALCILYVLRLGGTPTYPAFGDDNSVYLVSAESLATGHGYRLINFPDAPPSGQYPIGYPALLSLIFHALPFGAHGILAARLLTVAATLAWVDASRRLLARHVNAALAEWIALAIGVTPAVLDMSGQVMSDLIFGAIMLYAVLMAERSVTVRRAAVVGLVGAGAMLVRSIGVAVVGGIMLAFFSRRRWREAVAYAAAGALVSLPWIGWSVSHAGGTFHAYTAQNAITWRTPIANAFALLSHTAPTTLVAPFETRAWLGVSSGLRLGWLPTLVGFILAIPVVVGFADGLRKGSVVAWVLLPYMGIVLFWWWEPNRFTVPVIPLVVVCAAEGAKLLVPGFRRAAPAIAMASIAAALAVDAVWIAHVRRDGHWGGRDAANGWARMDTALATVRRLTPPDAVVFTPWPYGVYLFTGRHTGDLAPPDAGRAIERDAATVPTFILTGERRHPITGEEFGLAPVRRFAERHPDQLRQVWESEDGAIKLLAVTPSHDRE